MTRIPSRRQAGFTLIELLVVIGIIAVLAALSAGAFFRIRTSQQEQQTSNTIIKLQKALQQQITATFDNAKKEPIPPIVMAYAQNDPDRAKAIWGYLHLRKNFPENFAEALNPIVLPDLNTAVPYVIFPVQKIFQDRIPSGPTTLNADEQSAICLYYALTEINRRGMESGITDNQSSVWPQNGGTTKVFIDNFGQPLAFRRLLSNTEMQAKPFTNQAVGYRDPLDPLGKLAVSSLNGTQMTNLRNAIHFPIVASTQRVFNNTNFMSTIYSLGVNKKNDTVAGEPVGDDIYGYRLQVENRN